MMYLICEVCDGCISEYSHYVYYKYAVFLVYVRITTKYRNVDAYMLPSHFTAFSGLWRL